ncbi:hypothetical protein Slin14017_G063180 [Septoria linicola]|nr:hypothetical protein Slin14017_G063180 [Septoria linicola]
MSSNDWWAAVVLVSSHEERYGGHKQTGISQRKDQIEHYAGQQEQIVIDAVTQKDANRRLAKPPEAETWSRYCWMAPGR